MRANRPSSAPAAKARIRLVTRGDDAGSCRSANLAILETFQRGIVRNVSMMAAAPEVEHAAETFRNVPGLCLGFHAALNCEWDWPRWGPVLPRERVPSLLDADGCLAKTPQDFSDRHASLDEMAAELAAQLSRLRALGLKIAYLDQHMGLGWLPGLGAKLSALARSAGLLEADQLVKSLPGAGRHGTHAEDLIARLKAAPPGTYVAVGHPCYDDAETRAFAGIGMPEGQIGVDRDGQRRMFLDSAVLECCRELGVEPIRYTEVQR
ncbi:MAG: ChbG/HpnK family deacetylase [Planctomycetota bacterium]